MLENYQAEIEGELQAKLDSEEVTQRLAHDPFAKEHEHHRLMVTAISKEVEVVVKTHEDRGAAWYNEDDGQYESAMKVAMQLKQMALGKFQHWMEGAHAKELEKEPMHVVRRKALATLHRRLTDVQRRDLAGVGATVASELCKELGLLVKSVDETNEEGEPPLVEAGSGGNVWALELLLAAGCEVGSASQNGSQQGWTALHWASLVGHKGSVACLVEAGADVHATTEAGETCLTVAAGAGQSEVVKYLAEKGGVGLVLAVNSEGRSCAFLASEQGHHEALGVLLEAGGTELLMLTDKDGFSCAWVASMNGHAEALGVLIEAGGKELLMLGADRGGGQGAADAHGQRRQVMCAYGFSERARGGAAGVAQDGGQGAADADRRGRLVVCVHGFSEWARGGAAGAVRGGGQGAADADGQ
ncbi:ankyrin repeat-containing domain protein [Baffinella frigidus]|nr:ankyrin repeat-containing domain protein [Cryptophyta sp. CCMP2293]